MGQDGIIAGRYARALAGVARERNCVDGTLRDLRALDEILCSGGESHVPELAEFLLSPTIAPGEKKEAAGRILEKMGVGETAAHFVGVLVERGRIDLLPRIAGMFAGLAGELAGEHVAVVRTARPLTEKQSGEMAAALGAAFGGTVRIHQRVEPGLLAGARVTIGGKTIDGTVLGRLNGLRHRLAAAEGWTGAPAETERGTEK